MTQLQSSYTLEDYLKESEAFHEQETQSILETIDKYRMDASDNQELVQFFKGEEQYYQGAYESALQFYLLARTVPHFQFYCNRASAHIAFSKGNEEKALRFIEKGLSQFPENRDLISLKETIEKPEPEQEDLFSTTFDTPPVFKEEEREEFIAEKLGSNLTLEQTIEERMAAFGQFRSDLISKYLEESEREKDQLKKGLYILNGTCKATQELPNAAKYLFGRRETPLSSSGFYFRWEGKGIVVNPGESFLENFHEQNLYIKDIDHIIITRDDPKAYANITRIYHLNYQLNQVHPELHVINYYLNQKAYEKLSHTLKPNFKQERDTVHCLELFLDSPDVEKVQLDRGINLHYFSTTPRDCFFPATDKTQMGSCAPDSLGIRFDLSSIDGTETLRIGYLTGTAWSPLIAHNLGKCELLIAGFGTTNPNDFSKLNYTDNNLGYYGTFSLAEATQPKLLICTEFSGREGDIRLEVVKKLRQEIGTNETKILPGDPGLMMDLETFTVKCSVTKRSLKPEEVHVIKTHETFGPLKYLAPDCIL